MHRRSLLTAALLPLATPALAAWPTRPVRIVMPSGPGSNPDILARLWAQRLSETMGQPFSVENRTGGSGIIGTEAAMNAPPDGSTVLFGFNQLVTLNPLLFRRLPYDPARMTRISLVSDSPFVMLVHESLGVRTVQEFVALAKQRPGRIVHGTGGPGSFSHLSGEILMRDAGIELLHVPHRATPRSELVAGQVQLAFEPTALAITLTQAPGSTVRALAVMGNGPEPLLPGVPVLKDIYPGFVVIVFHAIWGPQGLPEEVAQRLSAGMTALVKDPWLSERMAPLATRLIGGSAADLDAAMAQDLKLWAPVVRERDIRLD